MKVQKLKDRCTLLESQIAGHEKQIGELERRTGKFKSTDETLRVTKILDERRSAGILDVGVGTSVGGDRSGQLRVIVIGRVLRVSLLRTNLPES